MELFQIQCPRWWGGETDEFLAGDGFEDSEGTLHLRRAGPFVPPLSVPLVAASKGMDPAGNLVATPAARSSLVSSGLRIAGFRQVDLQWVVRLDWHEWDRTKPVPVRPHFGGWGHLDRLPAPLVWMRMGPLWSLVLPEFPVAFMLEYEVFIDEASPLPPLDVFRCGASVLCNDRFREWVVESGYDEWVVFTPTPRRPWPRGWLRD